MTMTERQTKLVSLMERYGQIAVQLPKIDDLDPTDQRQIAECKVLLAELKKVQRQIEALSGQS
jgi:hypothetical protein